MRADRRGHLVVAAIGILGVVTEASWGQTDTTVRLVVDRIGLTGYARRGTWTPIRLRVQNLSAENRPVVCRWLLSDYDGDRVVAERRATLNPHRIQHVWLYGVPPVNARDGVEWNFHVVDARSGQLLASRREGPRKLLDTQVATVGLFSRAGLGLDRYALQYTQHEKLELLTGLDLTTLPDRWYGLSMCQALVWTADSSDPVHPAISSDTYQALRQWVRRGGHLVVMLPAVGQRWTSSPLADLLPVDAAQMWRRRDRPPSWLYQSIIGELPEIEITCFDVRPNQAVAVLRLDREGNPVIVARRYGFGRVTLIGIDLSDTGLLGRGMPSGRYPVWHKVFHWQSPILGRNYVEDLIDKRRMSRPDQRDPVELGRFIPSRITMRTTAAPAVLLAVLVFALYWLVAGPIGFAVLRHRQALRHSWVIFVVTVLVFSATVWAGAWLYQPRRASVQHFSVLDIDARTGECRTQSWLSLLVPRFGLAVVAIGAPSDRQTLASPGLERTSDTRGFLDPQPYSMDAGAPYTVTIPVRATAKQFEVNFLGRLDQAQPGLAEPWILPQGSLKVSSGWPAGVLSHGLPGTLKNVVCVYCPGADPHTGLQQTPWVWPLEDWPPAVPMTLTTPMQAKWTDRLVKRFHDEKKRQWQHEGFLGKRIADKTGRSLAPGLGPSYHLAAPNEIVQAIDMLSFYDSLPPPDFRSLDFVRPAVAYQRSLGRSLDLTSLVAGRRLILIGHLEKSPLPAPLTLDERTVESAGWTVVRWIYDFEEVAPCP